MTVLFDLGRKRAAPDTSCSASNNWVTFVQHRLAQAGPIDSRILSRMSQVQQLTIFNEKQAVPHYRRNRFKIFVYARRKHRTVERQAIIGRYFQAGLGFFPIWNKQAPARQDASCALKSAPEHALQNRFRQMLQQFREPAITEAQVIRPGLGEKRIIIWAVFHLPAQLHRPAWTDGAPDTRKFQAPDIAERLLHPPLPEAESGCLKQKA